ncbi:hypothetical protein OPQ81_005494 [Rhizoctonia solani]|nr:hypothetical protein OPQ81_005494 [Rhizoctonia solani]
MRLTVLAVLGYVSSLFLPSVNALNALGPDHVAELRVVPNSLTLMTPRDEGSILEHQLFDFGSPYSSRFLGLRRLGARQGCNPGFDVELAARLSLFVTAVGAAYQLKRAATTRDAVIKMQSAALEEAVVQVGAAVSPSMVNLGVAQMDKHVSANLSVIAPVTPPALTRISAARLETFALVIRPPMDLCVAILMLKQWIWSDIRSIKVNHKLILILLILWRRKQSKEGAESEKPPDGPRSEPSQNHAHGLEAVPPGPGPVDPFLTPMSQHPNPGASYVGGGMDRPVSGTGSGPQYTGLPEPQHGDDLGTSIGTSAMPVPRHDIHNPYPLPMSITPLRESDADSGPTRAWYGFSSRPTSGQSSAYGGGAPYQVPSGRSNHETTNANSTYSNLPGAENTYGFTPPRAPSTVYQPSSGGSERNGPGNHGVYSPPASPPPESLHPKSFGP